LHNLQKSDTINISVLTGTQLEIAGLLKQNGEMYIDSIAESLDISVPEIMNELLDMQMNGIVSELAGKLYKLG
jgi:predicted Rossmann fold nucleotide-binding protein DprA/Smf involved in DNA uptake